MAIMPGPLELLDLKDGQAVETAVESWEEGEAEIHPAHLPQGKIVQILRVHVPQADKALFPHYWDISSVTLQAQLKPYLAAGAHKTRRFRITKHGVRPQARFTLELV